MKHVRAILGGGALLALLWLAACGSTIHIPNRAPAASFGTLEGVGGELAIYYRLFDYEGDDVAVTIAACQAGACRTPTAGPGGDGVAHLPTEARQPILHLFVWNAACDLDAAALTQEWTLQITPADDEPGPVVVSDPFRPAEVGVAPDCVASP